MNPPNSDGTGGSSVQPSLDSYIDKASGEAAMAAVRKEHQATLAAFLKKADASAQDYNVPKSIDLVKRWHQQDAHIAELIASVIAKPKWSRGMHRVCKLFEQIKHPQDALDGTPVASAADDTAGRSEPGLYRLQATQKEWRDRAKREYERVKAQLTAWEAPAPTLEKILAGNRKQLDDLVKASDAGPVPSLAFDLFIKLVPLHLAIQPPGVTPKTTMLDRHGSGFDGCARAAQAAVGPQPSLIPPADYLTKQCPKVLGSVDKAMETLAAAEGKLKITDDAIARNLALIEARIKSFDTDAKTTLLGAAMATDAAASTPPA